jgi:signal transduction histidine kinase
MRAHGGEAVASNRPGGGAAVRIELPAGVTPIDVPGRLSPPGAATLR